MTGTRVTRYVWLRTPDGDEFKLTDVVEPTDRARGVIPLPSVELNGERVGFQWSADVAWAPSEPVEFQP